MSVELAANYPNSCGDRESDIHFQLLVWVYVYGGEVGDYNKIVREADQLLVDDLNKSFACDPLKSDELIAAVLSYRRSYWRDLLTRGSSVADKKAGIVRFGVQRLLQTEAELDMYLEYLDQSEASFDQ